MRNLSFALTTRQMRDRSKTVTRRRCDGRLICRLCARAATLRHRQGDRGLLRGDAWARNAAALEETSR